jgi:hypothetical protein
VTYRRFAWIVIAMCVAVTVLIFSDNAIDDSGVDGCNVMLQEAERKREGEPASVDTSSEYLDLRRQFTDSKYPDLRITGETFVNVAHGLAMDRKQQSADLPVQRQLSGELLIAYDVLVGSCVDHGVDLPTLGELVTAIQ